VGPRSLPRSVRSRASGFSFSSHQLPRAKRAVERATRSWLVRSNSKPEARSPKPEARSPKPEARSPKPEARSPKPEARSPKPRKLPAMSSCAKLSHFATCAPSPGRVTLACSQWPRSRVGLPRPRRFPAARRIRQRITDTQTFRTFIVSYEFATPERLITIALQPNPQSRMQSGHASRMCSRNSLSAECSQVSENLLAGIGLVRQHC
jgi:hypothetical protein